MSNQHFMDIIIVQQRVIHEKDDEIQALRDQIKVLTNNSDITNSQSSAPHIDCTQRLDNLEQYSRRNNLRISGIDGTDTRSTDDIVIDVAAKAGVTIELNDIDRSHYVSKPDSNGRRQIIVKFARYREKYSFIIKRKHSVISMINTNTKMFT